MLLETGNFKLKPATDQVVVYLALPSDVRRRHVVSKCLLNSETKQVEANEVIPRHIWGSSVTLKLEC